MPFKNNFRVIKFKDDNNQYFLSEFLSRNDHHFCKIKLNGDLSTF